MAGGNNSSSYLLKRTFFILVVIVPLLLLLYRQTFSNIDGGTRLTDNDSDISRNENGSQVKQNSNVNGELNKVSKHVEKLKNAELLRVSWTSVGGKGEKDSFHLFSAYYDNRSVSLRPAVVVFGYAWNEAKQRPLHCLLKYKDGHTECVKKPLEMRGIASCMAPNLGGLPYFFYCPAQQHSSPISVMVSEKSGCDPQFTSKEITVGNLNQNKKPPKKFGICIGGPIIENKESLQELVEFVSINKILGAELITIYIIPEKLNKSITNYLLTRFPDVLRLIEWKNLGIWSPLHYYGQYLLMQDCLYRSMYEVEHLFHQDIDEVFIPTGGNNWSEVVKKIPGLEKGAGFKHQNSFFTLEKATPAVEFLTNDCGDLKVPKYLTRTKRLPCFPGYNYRSKPMTIPRLALEIAVHDVCAVMPGYSNSIQVPTNLAILGHFRNKIPQDCINQRKTPVTELWASKYAYRLHEEMCCTHNTMELCNKRT